LADAAPITFDANLFVDNVSKLPTIDTIMTSRPKTLKAHALGIVQARGIARARDFKAAGVPLSYLKRMTEAGELTRLGRGLYQQPERAGENGHHDLAEAVRLVPTGVISLLSALRYHGLTTELPHVVWMTIPHKARAPDMKDRRYEIIRATEPVFSAGIEHIDVEGVDVPLYCVAKTIADCFKHRRRVGEDVAIEALRDALVQRKTTVSDLLTYAAIDRVSERIIPFIKAFQ
jgi:predicted transcriptional regulator of viral defense system